MGTEFDGLFDQWASTYDEVVLGNDLEYQAVFEKYNVILQAVADAARGHVLEFGVGTGNLSALLLEKGLHVTGVEPSSEMRKKAQLKHPSLNIVEGDFLSFPFPTDTVDTIVSTYAFHHLKAAEKKQAAAQFLKSLQPEGSVIMADTMFENEQAHQEAISDAAESGKMRLAHDLRTEYYPLVSTMKQVFEETGFQTSFQQMNAFVWLMRADK